jgi:purine/pyrimidine-nucleoside phosphorylase
MIKVNEYFNGKVKSLSFATAEGPATAGVMQAGEYSFGTNCVEIMKITGGVLDVQLPGQSQWKKFGEGQQFEVAADVKFNVKCTADVAYVCCYR